MTTPAKLKLTIYQGATFRKRLTWTAPGGTPVDLTGCTARMQVRAEVGSPTVLLSLTTVNGGITLGGALGAVSDAEGKRLEANLAALENAQSEEQMKESLKKIIEYSTGAKDRLQSAYNLRHDRRTYSYRGSMVLL